MRLSTKLHLAISTGSFVVLVLILRAVTRLSAEPSLALIPYMGKSSAIAVPEPSTYAIGALVVIAALAFMRLNARRR